MAMTYKRNDDLEKMLEEFASFDALESPKTQDVSLKNKSYKESGK